jgi:hypothetical protein
MGERVKTREGTRKRLVHEEALTAYIQVCMYKEEVYLRFQQVPNSVPCVVWQCVCANRSFNEGLSVLFLQCPCGRKVSFPGAGGGGRDATRHNHPAPHCAPGADTPGPIPTETLKRSSWDLAHLLTPGQYPPRAWGRYPQRDDRTRYLQGTWSFWPLLTLYTLRICCACAA